MQIFFRPLGQRSPERLARLRIVSGLLFASLLVATSAFSTSAQTLARPGWAGSGLTSQAWWQNAVIYRIQPQSFQDANGDGIGDLQGLAQRLDYLQSIGVDAILLESHATDPGFDDLLSDASRQHIRIVVQLGQPPEGSAPHVATAQQEINDARTWLRRGVAGVYIPGALLQSIAARASFNDAVFLMQQLRILADSFPGERIIIAGDTPAVEASAHGTRSSGPELVDGLVSTSAWDVAALRLKLTEANMPVAGAPLLQIAQVAATTTALPNHDEQIGREKILAALLLSSRGAVTLAYGQEIGLPAASIMQWTPTNLTKPRLPSEKAPPPVVYGAYRPYVRPAPSTVIGARPGLPNVALDTASAPPPVDPDTLPGFSAHSPEPATGIDAALNNVAVEDTAPDSLLNFYRRVLELHDGNATMRSGTVSFLDHDGEGALVWLRRAPVGARTVASVIVACNLSEHPVVLSLNDDLTRLHIHSGFLRPLLTSRHVDHVAQSTSRITLSPHSVYIGELHYYESYR